MNFVELKAYDYNTYKSNRINQLEKETNNILLSGITEENLDKYKSLRNELEVLRGDWVSVPPFPAMPSSKLCKACINGPINSDDCVSLGCKVNHLLNEAFDA